MREAVIVISDLYLKPGELAAEDGQGLPALSFAGRFGERAHLGGGWRAWLARWLGVPGLGRAPVAAVAAAALPGPNAGVTRWIATPVELVAGLTRVHLDRRGLVHLHEAELAELTADFRRTFGASGLALEPLGDGHLLLATPGIAAVAAEEPARCAGAVLDVPHGPAAAALLRLRAEIEMWLHAEPLNAARRARGAPPVTGLWLWGATGDVAPLEALAGETGARGGARPATAAFGADAFLAGLCRLTGTPLAALPADLGAVLASAAAPRLALVASMGGRAPAAESPGLAAAAA
ncbi:MAG TPA: hypothetical protein VGR80_08950, partial [Steroidobacteraceae bacterium]|nr:hypothetical protein [Steroidobacteraceae bacterium]